MCQANIWRLRRTNPGENNQCLSQCLTPFSPEMTKEKMFSKHLQEPYFKVASYVLCFKMCFFLFVDFLYEAW